MLLKYIIWNFDQCVWHLSKVQLAKFQLWIPQQHSCFYFLYSPLTSNPCSFTHLSWGRMTQKIFIIIKEILKVGTIIAVIYMDVKHGKVLPLLSQKKEKMFQYITRWLQVTNLHYTGFIYTFLLTYRF